jgi:hygromycin-B 7''-O-kinase
MTTRMLAFPSIKSTEAFRAWRNAPSSWLPLALAIAKGHGLLCEDIEVFETGTNLVVGVGRGLVLKIYPPFLRRQFTVERITLPLLTGHVDVPTPEIVAAGERDAWPYLVMTRLRGRLGSEVWPHLADDQKAIVLHQIGRTIAQVQEAPLGELAQVGPQWPVFIEGQIAQCRARHVRLGLPPKFLDSRDQLLFEAPHLIPIDRPPVILTGEYIPENFLLTPHGDGWKLAGLIDFGDVITGWGEYDLLGPSAFMTGGCPSLVWSLLSGFGYSRANLPHDLGRRLLALMFLHGASDPLRHVCIPGWEDKAETLFDLQHMLWPLEKDALPSG